LLLLLPAARPAVEDMRRPPPPFSIAAG